LHTVQTYPGAEMAQVLRATTSAGVRAESFEELPGMRKYRYVHPGPTSPSLREKVRLNSSLPTLKD
jgi:hypothetical protein